MNNKVLVHLLIPEIDQEYDLYIPINIRIGTVIKLLNTSLSELSKGIFEEKKGRCLYNTEDSSIYEVNKLVRETNIRNASVIVFM